MKLQWRLLILGAILVIAYCWRSSQLIIVPRRFISPYTPANFGLDYIPVKLLTKDKIELDAWFIPHDVGASFNPAPAIIICHGFGADKGDCMDVAKFLHRAKYNVLMFDFRAHGQSKGKYCSLGYYEYKDIEAAIRWLSERGTKKIGAIGFSMGGTSALLAAAKDSTLKAVVTDGAYLSFWSAVASFARMHFKTPKYPFIPPAVWTAGMRLRFNPRNLNLTNFLHHIPPRPVLIIHGSKDREIQLAEAHQIYSSLITYNPHPIPHASLWIVQGAHHMKSYSVAKEEYEHRIISFLDTAFQ